MVTGPSSVVKDLGLSDSIGKARQQVTDFATDQIEQAKTQATSFVEKRKTALADGLGRVSDAPKQSAVRVRHRPPSCFAHRAMARKLA